jgi:hypothetical protein
MSSLELKISSILAVSYSAVKVNTETGIAVRFSVQPTMEPVRPAPETRRVTTDDTDEEDGERSETTENDENAEREREGKKTSTH